MTWFHFATIRMVRPFAWCNHSHGATISMATLTVKNIPDDIYNELKRSAAEHRRSLNSEIIVRLERSLRSQRLDASQLLLRAEALQKSVALSPLTEEFLRAAKNQGRP
jgi:plasmid stability protein